MKWRDVEKKLPPFRNNEERQMLRVRMRFSAYVILSLSLIEHILSVVSAVAQVVDCPRIKSIYRAYYVKSFPQVFTLFSYSTALGTYLKFIHVTATFVWSFTDLFIMMISCGLSVKFKLINDRMLEDKGKVSVRPSGFYLTIFNGIKL
jgi:gustatory receptor